MLALDAAKYIINRCISFGHPISNLQLQKILYFCQLAHIKLSGKLLFSDEQFEAWQFGPVVRSIYVKYCLYFCSKVTIIDKIQQDDTIFLG